MPSVNLSDAEWGQVMAMISQAPWRDANPLLMKIGDQLRAHHQPVNPPQDIAENINLNAKGNGPDKEVRHE